MGERELASIERNGMKCSVPCQETEYRLEAGYLMINKYYNFYCFEAALQYPQCFLDSYLGQQHLSMEKVRSGYMQ